MKKNSIENITTMQKYEKYYHNAKKIENIKKNYIYIYESRGREAGETPATLAALAASAEAAAPTENRIIVGLAPSCTTGSNECGLK